jgi:hypothetical protein
MRCSRDHRASRPWLLRDVVHVIAESQGWKVRLLRVSWPAVYSALKMAELTGARLYFRSDSVLSLVFQNPAPDFTMADQRSLERRAYKSVDSMGHTQAGDESAAAGRRPIA